MKQSEFKKAGRLEFFNDDESLNLEVWFDQTNPPSWGGEFKRVFNGEFKSFKTFKGLWNDTQRLIKKFALVAT